MSEMRVRIEELEAEVASLKQKLDYAEAVAGIKRGQEDVARGKMTPLREVDRKMRAKYGIPRG